MSKARLPWLVIIGRQPRRAMRKLPHDVRTRINRTITNLGVEPRPAGCLKLSGHDNLWRIRVGEWRVTYSIEDSRLIILIVEVASRGGAYRATRNLHEAEEAYLWEQVEETQAYRQLHPDSVVTVTAEEWEEYTAHMDDEEG